MMSWKKRLKSFPQEKRKDAERLFDEIEKARILHNLLAKLVVDNMAYEVKVRVDYPESFWITSDVSFKKDIWQNTIVKNGLKSFDTLQYLVTPLLSPGVQFIYPLDWAWQEQQSKDEYEEDEEAQENTEDEEKYIKKQADWDLITELWAPVFDKLLNDESFSITELQDMERVLQEKWLSQDKNTEIFMMFVLTEITFTEEGSESQSTDERIILFSKLCVKDEKYKKLTGKTVGSKLDMDKKPLHLGNLFISPYKIYIKDYRGRK